MAAMTQPDACMMPSSASASPPALRPPKRRLPRPPQAPPPIELSSGDDEPNLPPPKRRRKSGRNLSSANVIDLCSDDNERTLRPPRKARKSQTRAPQEDEIIVLMSSDNEEPPARCSLPSGSKTTNSGRQSLSPKVSVPTLRPEQNGFADCASGQPEISTHHTGSSPSPPIADVHDTQLLTERQANPVLPAQDEMTSEPLQHIYNEAFQSKSPYEEADPPSPVFSWKARSKPTQVCEPRPFPSLSSPLLTPSFFRRIQEALAAPQNPTTSVLNDLVKGSSAVLPCATTAMKSEPVPSAHSTVASGVGERECPKPLSPGPSPRKSQAERVTPAEEIPEDDDLSGISPSEVVEADALHIASPLSPVKEPKTSQTEFAEQANTLNVRETTILTSRTSPSPSPPHAATTRKTVSTDLQQTHASGLSETEIQEIETMLLPESTDDVTDEELLVMGLCYPEY